MCTACVATICTRNYTAMQIVITLLPYNTCCRLPPALRDHHADAPAAAAAADGRERRRARPRRPAGRRRRSGKVGQDRPERRRRSRGGGPSKGARARERASRPRRRWPRRRGGGPCRRRRRGCRRLPRLGGRRTALGLAAACRIGTATGANRSGCAVSTSDMRKISLRASPIAVHAPAVVATSGGTRTGLVRGGATALPLARRAAGGGGRGAVGGGALLRHRLLTPRHGHHERLAVQLRLARARLHSSAAP